MSASGCWHGKCTFCVEKDKPYEVRPVEDCIEEIKEIKSQGYKEVFDDSATLPTGEWLERFLSALRSHNNFGIKFGCNCRVAPYPFMEMYRAGYRMLLFGIESANQVTLDKINKGVKVEDIIPTIKKASEAGLNCHGAFMFGFPWESEGEAQRTLHLAHYLLKKGLLNTAQASFYTTKEKNSQESQRKYINSIYSVWKFPEFWYNQIKDIRNKDDLKYLWKKIKSGMEKK
jgi:radical SAM superfamily enzyme YgiQ (UPF0313 family)